MTEYTPLPQHAEDKSFLDYSEDASPPPYPTAQPARRSKLRLVLTILAVLVIAPPLFVATRPFRHRSEKSASHHGNGYLAALVEDGFAIEPAYIVDSPMIHPHPSIELASSENGGRKGRESKMIPPKVAEGIFLGVPQEDSCISASRRYTENTHIAGSGEDHLTALRVKSELESFFGLPITGPYESVFEAGSHDSQRMIRTKAEGPRVWVDTYYPVMNEPVSREVSILLPNSSVVQWSAALREDIVEGDPFSKKRDEVPVFHGLSASGNVTAPIVFAGYGRKADFEALANAGVDVKGKITLVKYGGVFRGLKVKASEEAGAVGCIIYSDPKDDGPMTEANGHLPYPDGPARNPSAVQRGSVQYLSSYPGDPTTPGVPAYANATRESEGNIPRIPSIPMSYRDATELLKLLKGNGLEVSTSFGDEWAGGIKDIEYWSGPSEQNIRFVNEVDTKVMPIWNTMAVIPGFLTDEAVMIGNHRDAWTFGASDPSSGTAVTHEIYKGLGLLMSKGWKPLRTIIIASWDAEEYGLIGSTEWAEDFADWIPKHVTSYLNLDSTGAGTTFGVAASPSLALLMKSTSEEIRHPTDFTRSAFSARLDGGQVKASAEDFEALFAPATGIPSLGSGSDYTPILQHLGIASADGPGFSPGPNDPVFHYHSNFDNEYWMEKYGDPGFVRHVTASKILGLALLRLSDSLVLPLNITQYASELSDYRDKVAHIHQTLGFSDKLKLCHLSNSISAVQDATLALDRQTAAALKELKDLTHPKKNKRLCHSKPSRKEMKKIKKVLETIKEINGKLAKFESGFIDEDGLPGREWYKHIGTAPGKWLGYGATTFPSITEALTLNKDVAEANVEAERVASMLDAMTKRLLA